MKENEIVLTEESYVTVLYDAEKELGKIIWHGNPSLEEYKKPFLVLLEHAKSGHSVKRFYSDTRDQGIVNPAARKWFELEMVPAAMEAGLERAVAITSGNAFKRYYLNMILSAINKFNMPFKILGNEDDAVKFLMES